MTDLGPVPWPPAPLRTERLVLRETEAHDRPGIIDLGCLPEVRTHLGGPRSREELERELPAVPGRRPGLFAVEHAGSLVGTVHVQRREAQRPGHVRDEADEVELGYLFLPGAWGKGLATEACTAVLRWIADTLPGEPVLLCTQTANTASLRVAEKLGFTEAARFEEWDAEQWLGVWKP
jgi:RimJ/RimL family protein N-acetyltransferase